MPPAPVDPLEPYFNSISVTGNYPEGALPSVELPADISSEIHITIPSELYGYGNRGVYVNLLLGYAEGVEDSSVAGMVGNNEPYPSFMNMTDATPDGDRYYVKFELAFSEDWDYEAGQVHRTTFTLGSYSLPIVFEVGPNTPSVEIECNPRLPRNDYQNVTVEFSEPVTIEDFVNHVRVTIAYFEQEPFVATLSSIGSGQISVGDGNDEFSKFQGSGDDLHYTWSDLTSAHGPYLISIEWVD